MSEQLGGEAIPSAEELVAELRKAKVSDLLAHTCSLLASIGYGKLSPDVRDLEQARVAIEALKAIAPLLDEAPRRDVHQVIASLQLTFADAATPPAPESPAAPAPEGAAPPAPEGTAPPPEDAAPPAAE